MVLFLVNQLSHNTGISVWRIVWVTTNCLCMNYVVFWVYLIKLMIGDRG